ncbi:MAG: hypothetical protein FJX33_12515 [Alphaproteobacteria bacterium]|nr:hypothetical protein [Alphaproteobacteria bacterium]
MTKQPTPKKRNATQPKKMAQKTDQKTTAPKNLLGAVDSIGRTATELRVGFKYRLPNGKVTTFDSAWPARAYDVAEKAFFAEKSLFMVFTSDPKGADLIQLTRIFQETDLLP